MIGFMFNGRSVLMDVKFTKELLCSEIQSFALIKDIKIISSEYAVCI